VVPISSCLRPFTVKAALVASLASAVLFFAGIAFDHGQVKHNLKNRPTSHACFVAAEIIPFDSVARQHLSIRLRMHILPLQNILTQFLHLHV